MKIFRSFLATTLAAGVLALVACLEPTQIDMTLRTDVPYAAGHSVAIFVSKNGEPDLTTPSTTADNAWGADGRIGSLVLLPSERRDEPVSVLVVMGKGRDPTTCTSTDAAGCIFARRRLAFVPHEPLALPVTLFAACEGTVCDANSTCTARGSCVSSTLEPTSCAAGQVCEPGADSPADNGSTGAGSDDASTDAAASTEPSDGSQSDGSPDAGNLVATCDSKVVQVDSYDMASFGTFDKNALVEFKEPLSIILEKPGEYATFTRTVTTSTPPCAVHFLLDLTALEVDKIGAKVVLMTVSREDGMKLSVEVTNDDDSTYTVHLQGERSKRGYKWPGPKHAGIVELVVPLSPQDTAFPRLIVGGAETVFDDIASPGAPFAKAVLQFGLSGEASSVEYKRVRYFFGP